MPAKRPALSAQPETGGETTRADEIGAARLRREVSAQRKTIQAAEAELRALRHDATTKAELAELRGERIGELEARLAELSQTDWAVVARDQRIAELEEDLTQAKVRLSQMQSSLPIRAWSAIKRLPPLSWIAARRARRYWRSVDAARGR
jgi:predicted RNase H-like nuclease (RuvC/YqgF family)